MFKMGCSMAKKILAIDKTGGSSSSACSNNENRRPKEQQPTSEAVTPQGKKNAEELNDFSKLQEDPRLPLNVRQIFKITKSWKAIARTMSKTGTAMFLNLFEQNQDLFYLFDRFQHLRGKELHESMELREHAATVMSTLDQSINSLSDYDNFIVYLQSIGKLHRKIPGFKRAHFWKIEQPFMRAIKQTLDERCNETIEEIYKIAIKLIIETISEGYGEDQEESAFEGFGERSTRPGSSGGGGAGGNSDANSNNNNGTSPSDGRDEKKNSRAKREPEASRGQGDKGDKMEEGGAVSRCMNRKVVQGKKESCESGPTTKEATCKGGQLLGPAAGKQAAQGDRLKAALLALLGAIGASQRKRLAKAKGVSSGAVFSERSEWRRSKEGTQFGGGEEGGAVIVVGLMKEKEEEPLIGCNQSDMMSGGGQVGLLASWPLATLGEPDLEAASRRALVASMPVGCEQDNSRKGCTFSDESGDKLAWIQQTNTDCCCKSELRLCACSKPLGLSEERALVADQYNGREGRRRPDKQQPRDTSCTALTCPFGHNRPAEKGESVARESDTKLHRDFSQSVAEWSELATASIGLCEALSVPLQIKQSSSSLSPSAWEESRDLDRKRKVCYSTGHKLLSVKSISRQRKKQEHESWKATTLTDAATETAKRTETARTRRETRKTSTFLRNKLSLLASDPGDLGELIKMLMRTLASLPEPADSETIAIGS